MALPNQAYKRSPMLTCSYSRQTPGILLEDNDVLAVIGFGQPSGPTEQARYFNTGLPILGSPLCEVWRSCSEIRFGIDHSCHWSADDELMFLGLWIEEERYPDFKTAVSQSYCTLLQMLQDQNYPYPLRTWNYIPRINQGDGDNERYKQFCLGRHEAFCNFPQHRYPAATAIGHNSGKTLIYLIASRYATPLHFENPRQLSAFLYPRTYGPKSPSFSRASMLPDRDGKQIHIAGTASILGHQSQHPGDFRRQLEITCDNITTLQQHIGDQLQLTTTPNLGLAKVYIRNPRDLEDAQTALKRYFDASLPILYLQGDICRRELLIEIDGICLL